MNIKILGMLLGALLFAAPANAQDEGQEHNYIERLASLEVTLDNLLTRQVELEGDARDLVDRLEETKKAITGLQGDMETLLAEANEELRGITDDYYRNANPTSQAEADALYANYRRVFNSTKQRWGNEYKGLEAQEQKLRESWEPKVGELRKKNAELSGVNAKIPEVKEAIAATQKQMEEYISRQEEKARQGEAYKQLEDLREGRTSPDAGFDGNTHTGDVEDVRRGGVRPREEDE